MCAVKVLKIGHYLRAVYAAGFSSCKMSTFRDFGIFEFRAASPFILWDTCGFYQKCVASMTVLNASNFITSVRWNKASGPYPWWRHSLYGIPLFISIFEYLECSMAWTVLLPIVEMIGVGLWIERSKKDWWLSWWYCNIFSCGFDGPSRLQETRDANSGWYSSTVISLGILSSMCLISL